MSPIPAIALVGLGVGGAALVLSAAPRLRRPALARRLTPYLGALGPRRSALLHGAPGPAGILGALRPLAEAMGSRLPRMLGDDGRDVAERLAAAGSPLDTSAFRAEQATWALAGLAAGVGLALVVTAAGRPPAPVAALVVCGAFGAAGAAARDRALTRAVGRRRARARAELPTLVDLVCLAVTAGESLRGALDLVATSGTGPLCVELRIALRQARAGQPLSDALVQRARIIGLAPFDRFVAAVLASQERGMPLADALRAMAFDTREAEKRNVLEAAGRKQVAMLVPVIALVLPIAVVFAFFPGVVAIRTLAR